MAWHDHVHSYDSVQDTKVVAGRIIKVLECDCGATKEEDYGKAGGS